MATILFGISALEYHCTPPAAIDRADEVTACHGDSHDGIVHLPRSLRKNASDCMLVLDQQLNRSLVGLSEPFHIIDDRAARRCDDSVVFRSAQTIHPDELIPICPGLLVTTPERTLLDLCRDFEAGAVAAVICEMCGLYTIVPETDRLTPLLDDLARIDPFEDSVTATSASSAPKSELSGVKRHTGSAFGTRKRLVSAFLDSDGKRCDYQEIADTWTPCIARNGTRTTLWKRPPLCTLESLIACADANAKATGIQRFRKALRYAVEGSGSPAETICALLMGPDRRLGQEGLPPVLLNRRVTLNDLASDALGSRTCVVDISWQETKEFHPGCCVEVDGAAFHDDSKIDTSKLRSVNNDSVRRAALARCGLEVITVTWSQLADLSQWDIVVDLIYNKLGIKRRPPSKACLTRRERLHKELLEKAIH